EAGELGGCPKLAGTLAVLPDCVCGAADLFMRASNDQYGTRQPFRVELRARVFVSPADFLRPQTPIHFVDGPYPFKVVEPVSGAFPECFDSIAVLRQSLPLHLHERNRRKPRFTFQNP